MRDNDEIETDNELDCDYMPSLEDADDEEYSVQGEKGNYIILGQGLVIELASNLEQISSKSGTNHLQIRN